MDGIGKKIILIRFLILVFRRYSIINPKYNKIISNNVIMNNFRNLVNSFKNLFNL